MAIRRPVLVVESEHAAKLSLSNLVQGENYLAANVGSLAEALAWLRTRKEDPCAILLPASLASENAAKEFLQSLQSEFPVLFESLPILFARGGGDLTALR